jgi:hypothetical protein
MELIRHENAKIACGRKENTLDSIRILLYSVEGSFHKGALCPKP